MSPPALCDGQSFALNGKKIGWNEFCPNQCCQMVYFQTKNPNLGKFGKILQWKFLVFLWLLFYLTAKWYILWSFCSHLIYFSPFWYAVPRKIWQPWSESVSSKNFQHFKNKNKQVDIGGSRHCQNRNPVIATSISQSWDVKRCSRLERFWKESQKSHKM
jgi:hypothetical protein